jgi:hypothetical protein
MSDENAEFGYLHPLTEKFGGLWFEHEIKSRAASLSAEEVAALREAYAAIAAKQQVRQLTDWIDKKGVTAREKHLRRGAYVVLRLFEELGEKGVLPFSDRTVRYIRKFPPRDWSRVPVEFQFLSALADDYGIMLYEKGWDGTLAAISGGAGAKLKRAAEKLRSAGQVDSIQEWMNAQPESSVEVTALDGLLQLLDNFEMLR